MRFNYRMKIGNFTLFFMLSHTQTLEGVTSRINKNEHLIFWDLEGCNLDQAEEILASVQYAHRLGDIFITSDAEQSFRGWCFSARSWKEYLRILLETDYLDYNFFYWTVRRGSATLRINNKAGRQPQKVVAYLKGYEETEIPEKMVHVTYDTGLEKRGMVISLG